MRPPAEQARQVPKRPDAFVGGGLAYLEAEG